MTQCKAEYHSRDGKDSLAFSSHILFCRLDEGHTCKHAFYGGHEQEYDDRLKCPHCNNNLLQAKLDAQETYHGI